MWAVAGMLGQLSESAWSWVKSSQRSRAKRWSCHSRRIRQDSLDAADGTAIMAAEVFFTASPMVMRAERKHDDVRKSVGSSLKERSSNMTGTGDAPPVETFERTVCSWV